MRKRNTIARSLHDLGLATWFGGSLMGAAGLDRATAQVTDPGDRSRVVTAAWSRWGPINAAAIAAYLIGSARLSTASRARSQSRRPGPAAPAKAALTLLGLGVSGYLGWESFRDYGHTGQAGQAGYAGDHGQAGGAAPPGAGYRGQDPAGASTRATTGRLATAKAEPRPGSSRRTLGWVVPAATGALVIVSAYQGEQRLTQLLGGVARGLPAKAAKAAGSHGSPLRRAATTGVKAGSSQRRRWRSGARSGRIARKGR